MMQEVVVLIALGLAFSLAWGVLSSIRGLVVKRDSTRNELDDMRRRLDALEASVLARVQEVEERMDFAERLLARERPDRLPGAR